MKISLNLLCPIQKEQYYGILTRTQLLHLRLLYKNPNYLRLSESLVVIPGREM